MLDEGFYKRLISEFMKIAWAKYPNFAWDEQWCWNILESRVLKIKVDEKGSFWEELVEDRIKHIARKCERNEDKFWAYIRQMIRKALIDEFRDPRHSFEFKRVPLEDRYQGREKALTEIDPTLAAIAKKIFPELREKLETISLYFIEELTLKDCSKILGCSKSTAHRLKDEEIKFLGKKIEEAGGNMERDEWLKILKFLIFILKQGGDQLNVRTNIQMA